MTAEVITRNLINKAKRSPPRQTSTIETEVSNDNLKDEAGRTLTVNDLKTI